jgi:hypothetical protein
MRLGKKPVVAVDLRLLVRTLVQGVTSRSPIVVPVKTVFVFGSLFTGFRNDGHLNELLVEIEDDAVENKGKTPPAFLMINKSNIRNVSLVLAEIDGIAPLI